MPEVVRHLVDEERLAGAVDPGVGEIFLAQPQKLRGASAPPGRPDSADCRSGLAALQFVHDALDVGQLLRALDLRMRRQDLLEQRRARARQADDEDRIRRAVAPARAAREEVRACRPRSAGACWSR